MSWGVDWVKKHWLQIQGPSTGRYCETVSEIWVCPELRHGPQGYNPNSESNVDEDRTPVTMAWTCLPSETHQDILSTSFNHNNRNQVGHSEATGALPSQTESPVHVISSVGDEWEVSRIKSGNSLPAPCHRALVDSAASSVVASCTCSGTVSQKELLLCSGQSETFYCQNQKMDKTLMEQLHGV